MLHSAEHPAARLGVQCERRIPVQDTWTSASTIQTSTAAAANASSLRQQAFLSSKHLLPHQDQVAALPASRLRSPRCSWLARDPAHPIRSARTSLLMERATPRPFAAVIRPPRFQTTVPIQRPQLDTSYRLKDPGIFKP